MGETTFSLVLPNLVSSYKTKKSVINTILYCDECSAFLSMEFHRIGFEQANTYINHLKTLVSDGKYSLSTARVRVASLSRIATVLESLKIVKGYINPFKGAANIFNKSYIISTEATPDLDGMRKIFSSCYDDQLYLILSYALKCGFTTSELCSIEIRNLYKNNSGYYIAFPLPSGNYRYVDLPSDVGLLTEKYLSVYIDKKKCGFLFTNSRDGKLSERSLELMVKKYMQSIGLDFTIRDLRHSAIALLLASKDSNYKNVCSYFNITPCWLFRYKDIALNYIESASNCNSSFINNSLINLNPEWDNSHSL